MEHLRDLEKEYEIAIILNTQGIGKAHRVTLEGKVALFTVLDISSDESPMREEPIMEYKGVVEIIRTRLAYYIITCRDNPHKPPFRQDVKSFIPWQPLLDHKNGNTEKYVRNQTTTTKGNPISVRIYLAR